VGQTTGKLRIHEKGKFAQKHAVITRRRKQIEFGNAQGIKWQSLRAKAWQGGGDLKKNNLSSQQASEASAKKPMEEPRTARKSQSVHEE